MNSKAPIRTPQHRKPFPPLETAQNNPWAICTAKLGRNHPKYEECVRKLKAKVGK